MFCFVARVFCIQANTFFVFLSHRCIFLMCSAFSIVFHLAYPCFEFDTFDFINSRACSAGCQGPTVGANCVAQSHFLLLIEFLISCMQLRLSFPPDQEVPPDAGKSHDERRASEQPCKRGPSSDGTFLVPGLLLSSLLRFPCDITLEFSQRPRRSIPEPICGAFPIPPEVLLVHLMHVHEHGVFEYNIIKATSTLQIYLFFARHEERHANYENHLLSAMSWLIFLADSGNAAMA